MEKDDQKPKTRRSALLATGLIALAGALLFFLTGAEATLILILPFGLAGAISPMMLTTQTVILTTPKGKKAAAHYALGAAGFLFIFIALLIFFGLAISLPHEPQLSAQVDIVAGIFLIAVSSGLYLAKKEKKNTKPKEKRSFSSKGALGFGSFSMATNFTTLALMIPAAKMISSHDHVLFERALLATTLVFIASIPAWLPVALSSAAPEKADRLLGKLARFIDVNGRLLIITAIGILGIFLLSKGLFSLL